MSPWKNERSLQIVPGVQIGLLLWVNSGYSENTALDVHINRNKMVLRNSITGTVSETSEPSIVFSTWNLVGKGAQCMVWQTSSLWQEPFLFRVTFYFPNTVPLVLLFYPALANPEEAFRAQAKTPLPPLNWPLSTAFNLRETSAWSLVLGGKAIALLGQPQTIHIRPALSSPAGKKSMEVIWASAHVGGGVVHLDTRS